MKMAYGTRLSRLKGTERITSMTRNRLAVSFLPQLNQIHRLTSLSEYTSYLLLASTGGEGQLCTLSR